MVPFMPPAVPFIELPDLLEIKLMRDRLGWTQKKLAQACGVSQSYINKIERSEADPGYRKAKEIFRVLGEALAGQQNPARKKTARDIMTRHAGYISSNQTVEEARRMMLKNDYSQLPVIDNGIVKGSITDRRLMSLLSNTDDDVRPNQRVSEVMDRKFPVADLDTKLETLRHLLEEYPAVLVNKGSKEFGIVTKHDLLKAAQ
jgi:predicted transcriptional regulator